MTISLARATALALIISAAACGRQAQVSSPASSAAPAAPSIDVRDGESLIRAMHARYGGRWPKTMTYTQTTTLLGQTGQNTDQLWYVALSAPGKQRVDFVNPDLGNGLLVRSDTTYNFSNGRQVRATPGWTDMLLLTQDVYHQPPEVTISVLRSLGFQLSRIVTRSFDGRTAFVIGASTANDSSSKQFWVERDRMVLVRIREKRGERDFIDIRIGDHVKAGEGWIARNAYQIQNGVPRLHQQVSAVRADVPLDPALFEPRQWTSVKHWAKP